MIPRPPLRYHGGKWRLAAWIISHFPPHVCYVEPYGGAAGVLLQKSRSTLEVYNDAGQRVVTFFRVLREQPEALIRALELTPYSRAEFAMARDARRTPPADPVEDARQFFILSWQGRGGPLARWNTGWRFQRNDNRGTGVAAAFADIDHLHLVAERLRGVQIECGEALQIITRYDAPTTLFYCDPPYLPETRSKWGAKNGAAYEREMTNDDHRALAAALCAIEGMAIVSGYQSELYDELYAGWELVTTTTQADSGSAGAISVTECLWISPRAAAARLPLMRLLDEAP